MSHESLKNSEYQQHSFSEIPLSLPKILVWSGLLHPRITSQATCQWPELQSQSQREHSSLDRLNSIIYWYVTHGLVSGLELRGSDPVKSESTGQLGPALCGPTTLLAAFAEMYSKARRPCCAELCLRKYSWAHPRTAAPTLEQKCAMPDRCGNTFNCLAEHHSLEFSLNTHTPIHLSIFST